MYSTLDDLILWQKNIPINKLGLHGQAIIDKMGTPSELDTHEDNNSGFGLFINDYQGKLAVGHDGSAIGFSTDITRLPKEKFDVICLSNTSQGAPTSIVYKIFDIFYPPAPVPQTTAPVLSIETRRFIEKELKKKEGIYYDSIHKRIAILSIKNDTLQSQSYPGFRANKLMPLDSNKFKFVQHPLIFEFKKSASGEQIQIGKYRRTYHKMRLADTSQYSIYEGIYKSDELGSTFNIEIIDGKLKGYLGDEIKVNLEAIFLDAFTTKEYSESAPLILFERDERKNIKGLFININTARNLYFSKINFVTIKGKIVDSKSQNIIPHATVSVKRQPGAAISNERGEFSLKVLHDVKDTLIIQMMGFKMYQKGLKEASSTNNFYLEEDPEMMSTVIVMPELTAKQIIQKAIKKIPHNFPDEPFVLEGLYRETRKEGQQYVFLVEAAVNIFDENYRAPLFKSNMQERVIFQGIRKSFLYNNKKYINAFEANFKWGNWLEHGLLMHNFVRYSKFPWNSGKAQYKLDSIVYIDKEPVFVISVNQWRIWVRSNNFAFIKIICNWEGPGVKTRMFNDSLTSYMTLVNWTYEFKEYKDKMHLDYCSHTIKGLDSNSYSKKALSKNEYFHELIIGGVNVTPLKKEYVSNSKFTVPVWNQVMPYNAAFWKDFKRTPEMEIDKRIIEDLEKEVSLEDQFSKQSNLK